MCAVDAIDLLAHFYPQLEYQRQQLLTERQQFHQEQLRAAEWRARSGHVSPDDAPPASQSAMAVPQHQHQQRHSQAGLPQATSAVTQGQDAQAPTPPQQGRPIHPVNFQH